MPDRPPWHPVLLKRFELRRVILGIAINIGPLLDYIAPLAVGQQLHGHLSGSSRVGKLTLCEQRLSH